MPVNINLVFDEIKITPNCKAGFLWRLYAFPAGDLLGFRPYIERISHKFGWKLTDQEKEDEPNLLLNGEIYFPSFDAVLSAQFFSKDRILSQIQKYFEVFDVNIQIADSIPDNWDGSDDKYVKILPPYTRLKSPNPKNLTHGEYYDPNPFFYYDLYDKEFGNLPEKYYPYKRIRWLEYNEGVKLFDFSETSATDVSLISPNSFDLNYTDCPLGKEIAISRVIAHEIGHLLNITPHAGDSRDPDSKTKQGSYYPNTELGIKNSYNWCPMMGSQYVGQIVQWQKSDYRYSDAGLGRNKVNEYEEIIGKSSDKIFFKKTNPAYKAQPKYGFTYVKGPHSDYIWQPAERNFNNIPKKPYIFEDKKYAKYLRHNETYWEGLIGYDKDYDIIKVLLPAGNHYASVEPSLDYIGQDSMLDPSIEILYCDCEKDLDISIDPKQDIRFTPPWPLNNETEFNKYQPTIIRNKIGKESDFIAWNGELWENDPKNTFPSNRLNRVEFSTEYTTLVYFKIRGNWRSQVEPFTKIPRNTDDGYSDFGSVGKYQFTISTPSMITSVINSDKIPYGICNKFKICGNNKYLFTSRMLDDTYVVPTTQNYPTNRPGRNDNLHYKKLSLVINGELAERYFLVFGEPIDKNAPEEEGKFYLLIDEDGVCKKQEFVVGMGGDLEERGLLKD